MYNGIGLTTPRGSGTNGHVQRNWAFVRPKEKDKTYRTEDELIKLDTVTNRQPNKEILDHERKRRIELKCAEFSEILEEQGFSEETIRNKVNNYRTMLMGHNGKLDGPIDQWGRLSVTGTHQLAEAQQEKNARLREAFGISEYFVDGSSFDSERGAKEQLARSDAKEEQERRKALEKEKEKEREKSRAIRYELVHTPSPEPPSVEAKKKKLKNKESSSSEDTKKKRKLKKHKKERLKTKAKKKKVKRKTSGDSSSSDDSSSSSDESDSEEEKKKKKLKKKEKKKKKKYSSNDSSRDSSPEPVRKKPVEKHGGKVRSKENEIDASDRHNSRKRERSHDYRRKQSPSPKRSKRSHSRKARSRSREDHNSHVKKPPKSRNCRSKSISPDNCRMSNNHRSTHITQNRDKRDYNKKDRPRSRSREYSRRSSDYDRVSRHRERSYSPRNSSKSMSNSKSGRRTKSPEYNHTKRGTTPLSPKHRRYSSSSLQNTPPSNSYKNQFKDNGKSSCNTPEKKNLISEPKRKSLSTHKENRYFPEVKSNVREKTRSVSKMRVTDDNHHSSIHERNSKSESIERDSHRISVGKESLKSLTRQSEDKNCKVNRKTDSPDTPPVTKVNHLGVSELTLHKDVQDQKKSIERSPKHRNRQQMPVVRLRSSSEDEKSDHENDHVDEETEKELRMLRALKSGLAAKAKESLERKMPKTKTSLDEMKNVNEEVPDCKAQVPKTTTIVPDAFDIKVPLKSDSTNKVKLEEINKPCVLQEDCNEFVLHKRDNSISKMSKSISRSRTRSRSISTSKKAKFESSSRSSYRSRSRSRSASSYSSSSPSRSPSRTRNASRSHSESSSRSSSSVSSRSRSPSIPRRHGSPSFLDRRRITSKRV